MKAYQITSFETPPAVAEIERPTPGKGEVLVRVHACGLNFGDLLMATGSYQEKPPLPFTLGMEIGGVVEALGDDVTDLKVGDRISSAGGTGGMAEYACMSAARCLVIPDTMSFEQAAAFQVAYGTSEVALNHKAHLQKGERLLVLGAAGGVGLTAIEIGKLMGAEVIACARGADKLEICRQAGADHVIDSASEDLRQRVKDLGGADVVYDPVGGDQFKAAFRACNPEARIIVVGFASGDIPQIPANHLLVKNISVIGHYWGGYKVFRPEVMTESLKTLLGWFAEGKLHPHISKVFPLDQAGEALEFLRARKSTGKVIVKP